MCIWNLYRLTFDGGVFRFALVSEHSSAFIESDVTSPLPQPSSVLFGDSGKRVKLLLPAALV